MAGLRAIPRSYYEAARIDGVSSWTVLWEITLPLLRPTIVFLVVFSSIAFLRIFDHVFNMTSQNPGGPLNSTKPLVLMIYQTAFSSFDMGYAAAQTVVLFLVLLGVSLVQLRILEGPMSAPVADGGDAPGPPLSPTPVRARPAHPWRRSDGGNRGNPRQFRQPAGGQHPAATGQHGPDHPLAGAVSGRDPDDHAHRLHAVDLAEMAARGLQPAPDP